MFCSEHCDNCFFKNCKETLCFIINCPNNCGMRMHSCKVNEHIEYICQETVVCCINKEIGCPHFITRKQSSFHLKYCPACVIFCNMPRSNYEMLVFFVKIIYVLLFSF